MTLDEKLRALRDVIQEDVGHRGLARDPERNLINACPDDFAAACRSIGEHPSPSVAVVTGFWIPTAEPPAFETDGPLGSVFLARAFLRLGISTEIMSDAGCSRAVRAGLLSSSIPRKLIHHMPSSEDDLEVVSVLASEDVWTASASKGNETLGPSHWLSIERVGPAADGRCYTMRGIDVTERMIRSEHLFTLRKGRSFGTSIGIGDGGNEIGMGKIPVETIERNIPNGDLIHCRVATDHLIVAGVSNWGAYALAAGVALVRGQKLDPALFDPERERAILAEMVARGPLVDGVTGRPTATVDGLDFATYIRPLVRIGEIVAA
jgi:hypothetical protein